MTEANSSTYICVCVHRFKPAPIYILDEVDAALDLNHTQNIGAMIKQHFPQVGADGEREGAERGLNLFWDCS